MLYAYFFGTFLVVLVDEGIVRAVRQINTAKRKVSSKDEGLPRTVGFSYQDILCNRMAVAKIFCNMMVVGKFFCTRRFFHALLDLAYHITFFAIRCLL